MCFVTRQKNTITILQVYIITLFLAQSEQFLLHSKWVLLSLFKCEVITSDLY